MAPPTAVQIGDPGVNECMLLIVISVFIAKAKMANLTMYEILRLLSSGCCR